MNMQRLVRPVTLVFVYAFSRSIAMLYKDYVNTLFLHPSGRAQFSGRCWTGTDELAPGIRSHFSLH